MHDRLGADLDNLEIGQVLCICDGDCNIKARSDCLRY
jgi:hypothetical protein